MKAPGSALAAVDRLIESNGPLISGESLRDLAQEHTRQRERATAAGGN